ncbi:hypothetical protein BIV25_45015 [Streptomyces sp. MUSC 14]|nr:hypothetical protein BIV25_45015 [Streptomyces sp. MUSC 14]
MCFCVVVVGDVDHESEAGFSPRGGFEIAHQQLKVAGGDAVVGGEPVVEAFSYLCAEAVAGAAAVAVGAVPYLSPFCQVGASGSEGLGEGEDELPTGGRAAFEDPADGAVGEEPHPAQTGVQAA